MEQATASRCQSNFEKSIFHDGFDDLGLILWILFCWGSLTSGKALGNLLEIRSKHRVPTRKTCFSHPGDHPTPSRCPRNVSRAILKNRFFMMILIFGGRFLDFHLWRILNKWAKSLEID